MLGIALNAQRAGWADQPAVARMTGTGTLGYRVYQTPSFSMKLGILDNNSGFVETNGQYDVTGIGALSSANSKRCVIASTFKLDWGPGLAPGPGNYIMNFFNNVRFWQPGFTSAGEFWSINAFDQFRDNDIAFTGRMETPNGIFRAAETLAGDYEDYNNRWLTFIYAEAETSSVFANWSSTAGTGNYYGRSSVYDTETRELLQTLDIAFTPTGGFIPYLNYETGNNIVYTDSSNSGVNTVGFSVDTSDQYQREPWYINNIWAAFGSTFDPANVPDSSLFTTRPNETQGNSQAWLNIQFVEADVGNSYQVLDQGDSRYSEASDRVMGWVGNLAAITACYTTTEIPKDRNI